MSGPAFAIAVRLRALSTGLAALGMFLVILLVGALFPAVGDAIGKLDLPDGVADLLGGADYSTIEGWMRSEIGAVYGPLVIAGTAITGAVASTAGEEEAGILGLTLAHPIDRSRMVLAKAAAVAVCVAGVAIGTLLGLMAGVAVAGGGVGFGRLVALCLHLGLFGLVVGAVALALAAATGRKTVAAGGAAAFAVLGFLINGFAPLVDEIEWLKYVSPFYYYEGHDPLANGVDVGDLAVLAGATIVLTAIGVARFRGRDLRG